MQARLEDAAQCLLVIVGATPEGKKELVGLIDGVRECAQSWRELLLDLKRRGLAKGPELAVADGALGFWQAIVIPNAAFADQVRFTIRYSRCLRSQSKQSGQWTGWRLRLTSGTGNSRLLLARSNYPARSSIKAIPWVSSRGAFTRPSLVMASPVMRRSNQKAVGPENS